MKRQGSMCLGLVVLLAGAGCAPVTIGRAAVTDVPKGSEEHRLATGALQGRLDQQGMNVSMQVERVCDVERFDVVERTSVRSYENGAPANSVWTGIGGALFAGLGGVLAAAPSSFGDGTDSSNKQVRLAGAGVAAVGAALLVIPLIDYVRTHGEADRRVERVSEPGPMLRHGEACGAAPAGTRVNVELTGRSAFVGTVDARGRLDVSIEDAIPAAWHFAPTDRAFVQAEDSGLGALSLTELYASREASAWKRVAESACIETAACDGERDYQRDYASGPHAEDAQARIAASAAHTRAEEEEKAWLALDVRACTKPAPNATSHDVESACRPLRTFATAYPSSAHADQLVAPLASETTLRTRLETKHSRAAR